VSPADRTQPLRAQIRDVPDFPKPGIVFKDITPLLADPASFRLTIELLGERVAAMGGDFLVGIESRGFLFAAPLADRLGLGLAPARKPGKLPYKRVSERYQLEYGDDSIEMHEDAVHGRRVVLIDDVLATGGTAAAAIRLCERLGARVIGATFVIELGFLKGRARLASVPTDALLVY
jgi:adenine phosphoribosyltransferase